MCMWCAPIQDPARMQQDLKDRNKFGRFWFR